MMVGRDCVCFAKTVSDGAVFAFSLHTDGRNPPGESTPTIPFLTTSWSSQLASYNLHSSTLATPGMDHSLKVSLLVGETEEELIGVRMDET